MRPAKKPLNISFVGLYKEVNMNSKAKDFIFVFVSFFAVVLVIYGFIVLNENRNLTGQAVLEFQPEFKNGIIDGVLIMSLDEGELIPADSKVFIENSGDVYEYPLNELVSEESVYGNYNIKGASISGTGEGYGILSSNENSEIYFQMEILTEIKEESGATGGSSSPTEETPAEPTESNETTETTDEIPKEGD